MVGQALPCGQSDGGEADDSMGVVTIRGAMPENVAAEDASEGKAPKLEAVQEKWSEGLTIDHRFKLLRPLCLSDTMLVWTGYDLLNNRAVTVMQLNACQGGRVPSELRQQALVASYLFSDVLCRVVGVGGSVTCAYAVYQSMQGAITLEEEVSRFGNLSEGHAASICEQVISVHFLSLNVWPRLCPAILLGGKKQGEGVMLRSEGETVARVFGGRISYSA